jgi:membrane dipeptidase
MVTFVPSYLSEPLRQWTEQRRERRRDLARLHPDDLKLIDAEMDKWREANPAPACTLADVADHIDHVRAVAGIDHVGIGSDFDGIGSLPEALQDVSKYPDLIAELLARGYSDDDVRKVLGRNLLRVMRAVESVADRLADRPPSDALIEQLDRPADEGGDAARGS